MTDKQLEPVELTPEERELIQALRRREFSHVLRDISALMETSEQIPTRDELLAMPPEERSYWLRKAAASAEILYLNDPELTVTADTTDLYDYPTSECSEVRRKALALRSIVADALRQN
jgi:hypothetical protein